MYTNEENILQLISLLKAHKIQKVVASPGNTNITFIGSIQNDNDFEIFSCVDERSAAYLACGLAEESGEPVVISCTGATAARNYPSALTEAFYKKLPIVAVTSSQAFGRVGQLFPQFTDRNNLFNDIATLSVQIPHPYSDEERWSNNVKLNNALLQTRRNGGGPVHINLETIFHTDFSVNKLPDERVIRRSHNGDTLPAISAKKICIFVGSHKKFDDDVTSLIEIFCDKYNAVVVCDHTSNYKGKYRVLGGLAAGQTDYCPECLNSDLMIHLGEISGAYYSLNPTTVWRVSEDGEIRDPFKKLTHIFGMKEKAFFAFYNNQKQKTVDNTYFNEWKQAQKLLEDRLPDLPLSNVWVAQVTSKRLPENAVLHLGILNSLRSWNLFEVSNSIYSYSNVGGFGIDGIISTAVGASLASKDKIHFCILGDLATFYDLNVLGNRHLQNNLRIIMINNGTGYEMHTSNSVGKSFGDSAADVYFAAGGHNGNQSRKILKHFAEDLGLEYIAIETKEDYMKNIAYITASEGHDKPLFVEVFVKMQDDDFAYEATKQTIVSSKTAVKDMAKNLLGEKKINSLKNLMRR